MKKNNLKKKIREDMYHDTRPVSVDISCTVYNHGKYLKKALDGMLMQKTNFPIKIYIHDDASTDESKSIILEYQRKYPEQIVAIVEDENLYQNGKSIWEKMFPYYTSKYVAYCEGDDFWIDEKKLQKQVDYLELNPDCIACYHNILPVDKNSNYNEDLRGIYIILEEGDYTKKEVRHGMLKTQTASLVRRNYNPWLSEMDKKIYIQTKCNGDVKQLVISGSFGRVHYLSDVMAAHRRVFDEGESWTAIQNKKQKYERFIERQQRYLQLCSLSEYYHNKRIYPYNYILDDRLDYLLNAKRAKENISVEEKKKISKAIHIPLYAYAIYFTYLSIRGIKYFIHKLGKN